MPTKAYNNYVDLDDDEFEFDADDLVLNKKGEYGDIDPVITFGSKEEVKTFIAWLTDELKRA